jgi:hypothetical protein
MLKVEIQWKTARWSYRIRNSTEIRPLAGRWRIVLWSLWINRKKCSMQWKSPQFTVRQISQTRICDCEIMGTVCVSHHRSLLVPFAFLRTCKGVTEQTPIWVQLPTASSVDCTLIGHTITLHSSRRNAFSPWWLNGKHVSMLMVTAWHYRNITSIQFVSMVPYMPLP